MRSARFAIAAIAGFTTGACSLLVSTSGLTGGQGGDAAAPTDSGSDTSLLGSDASSVDATTCAECTPPPRCDGGPCPARKITTEANPRDIVADDFGVYWTVADPGDIRRADREGNNLVTVFDGDKSPNTLALGKGNGRVYWTEPGAQTIRTALQSNDRGPVAAQITAEDATYIAVGTGETYWNSFSTGAIRKATLDLGAPATITTIAQSVVGIVATPDFLYIGVSGGVERVQKWSLVAGQLSEATPKVDELSAFAYIDGRLYFASSGADGLVASSDLGGQDIRQYATGESAPSGVAVDPEYVYWTCRGSGHVKRAPRGGGPVQILAANQAAPTRITVNMSAVYWINTGDGTVMMAELR